MTRPEPDTTLEVERSIIGLAMSDPDQAKRFIDAGVAPNWFFDPTHARVWSAIIESDHGFIVEVKKILESQKCDDVLAMLTGLADESVRIGQESFYLNELKTARTRREVRRYGLQLAEHDDSADLGAVLDDIRRNLEQLEGGFGDAPVIAASEYLATEPPEPVQIISDVLDAGDKLAVIASSKARKTFLVKQLAIAVATGTDFAGLVSTEPRPVLYVNLEIRGHHFHRRLNRLARAVRADAELLGRNLHVINVRDRRGASITLRDVQRAAKRIGAKLIVLDPLYKLHVGDENAAADMKPLMRDFDAVNEATGAAIAYVHHDPKGQVGDRKQADRGAGSNVIGRDYDAAILMTPHRSDPDAVVLEFVVRNYAPREAVVVKWDNGCFTLADDLEPVKESSMGGRPASGKSIESYADAAFKLVLPGLMPSSMFHEKLKTELGLSESRARALTQHAITKGIIAKHRKRDMSGIVLVGTPGAIREVADA